MAVASGRPSACIRLAIGSAAIAASLGWTLAQTPFVEQAVIRGIDYTTGSEYQFGYGVGFADLDNDGDPDVIALGRSDGLIGIYENSGTGNFTDRSSGNGAPLFPGASGLASADYDNDGDLDLYITNVFGPNLLLRNDGAFTFTDTTVAAGVGDGAQGEGPSWGDYDGDGWLDLYLPNYSITPSANPGPNRLYRNQGDGTFVDVLAATGMDGDGYTFQARFLDYDEDGDADLYISNDRCVDTAITNRLWRNDGGTFTEVTSASQTGACIFSMGVAVGDFDRDMTQDLYATNLPFGNPLYLNQGNGTFTESSVLAGVVSLATGWGANFFDFDNDTHLELFVCNDGWPNRMYNHDGSWPCVDQATAYGVTSTAYNSFGSAVADIDGDGDLDLLVSNRLAKIELFVNKQGELNNWIKFRVVGEAPNRFAVGAKVRILTGVIEQVREIHSGTSYKSQDELPVHFGVEPATVIDEIEVIWPGGSVTRTLLDLDANQTWTLYPPALLADSDQDGDVDLQDFFVFRSCRNAAGGDLVPGCETMDLEGDADVDNADFVEFLARYDGALHDCDANGTTDLQDILDGTLTDGGNGVPDICESSGAPAGATGEQLNLAKAPGGEITLTWDPSCIPGDGDYAIYEGLLGSFGGHASTTCTTGGATASTLTPAIGETYYLVVPNNGAREGSYGSATAGPRPVAAAACLLQDLGTCE